jgi:hypothetical protein
MHSSRGNNQVAHRMPLTLSYHCITQALLAASASYFNAFLKTFQLHVQATSIFHSLRATSALYPLAAPFQYNMA